MARTLDVKESTSSLRKELAKRLGEPAERPLRLLLCLKSKRQPSLRAAAKVEQISYSSAKRWVSVYESDGLAALLNSVRRSSSESIEKANSATNGQTARQGGITGRGLTRETIAGILREAPQTGDKNTFTTWVKGRLEQVFPDVDRVGFTAVSTHRPDDPARPDDAVIYHETIVLDSDDPANRVVHSEAANLSDEPRWKRMCREAHNGRMIDFEQYHKPTGFDVTASGEKGLMYLGAVVFLRSAEKSPISRETTADFPLLNDLLVRLISEHSALYYLYQLQDRTARELEKYLIEGESFAPGELRVLTLALRGINAAKIAEKEGVSKRAIEDRCRNLIRKTGSSTMADLVGRIWGQRADLGRLRDDDDDNK